MQLGAAPSPQALAPWPCYLPNDSDHIHRPRACCFEPTVRHSLVVVWVCFCHAKVLIGLIHSNSTWIEHRLHRLEAPSALDGPNRQAPIASVQRTLSTNVIMCYEGTPIVRSKSQRNECSVSENQSLYFGGWYDRRRSLVIRIALITLASDSVKTMLRFRPSKPSTDCMAEDCRAVFGAHCGRCTAI